MAFKVEKLSIRYFLIITQDGISTTHPKNKK